MWNDLYQLIKIVSQENVTACLATTAIGGIWVSAAADFGPEGVMERYVIISTMVSYIHVILG